MSKKIYVFLAQGFEITEALATVDVLRRAKLDTQTVSITSSLDVESSNGITVKADTLFSDIDASTADMLLLPGGMPGTLNLEAFKPLTDLVASFHKEGKFLAAICAAPSIFGHLGLLKGKEAICYPGFENELEGAKLSSRSVVRDGNIITAKGMGVSCGFALEIIKALLDDETADQVTESAIIE